MMQDLAVAVLIQAVSAVSGRHIEPEILPRPDTDTLALCPPHGETADADNRTAAIAVYRPDGNKGKLRMA